MSTRNVRDFGAIGNGLVDDHDAILAAIMKADAEGGGVIYFPAGRYAMPRREQYAGLWRRPGAAPLRFVGDGPGASSLVMQAGSYVGDFYLLRVEAPLELEGLTLDGNRANIPTADEQTHLVQLHDMRRFVARDVVFQDAKGDGIKAAGSGGTLLVDDVLVTGCTFRNNGRSGITVQRAIRNTRIVDCLFEATSDQDIDFEPSGTTSPMRVLIRGNVFEHTTKPAAVTLCGISDADRAQDVIFEGNTINGGGVFGANLRGAIFRGNTVRPPPAQRALDFSRGVDDLTIEGNHLHGAGTLVVDGVVVEAAREVIYLATANARAPVGITIKGNTVVAKESHGVIMESVASVCVEGNRVREDLGHGSRGIQVRATAPGFPVRDVVIASNVVEGFTWGVSVDASQNEECRDVTVHGNSFSNRLVPGTLAAKKVGIELAVGINGHGLKRVTLTGNHAGEGINVPVSGPVLSGAGQLLEGSLLGT